MYNKEIIDRFFLGEAYDAYKYFGAHKTNDGYVFRVYAPNAVQISLIGDFNYWDGTSHIFSKIDDRGIFEIYTKDIKNDYELYRFRILTKNGNFVYKSDPFAFLVSLDQEQQVKHLILIIIHLMMKHG